MLIDLRHSLEDGPPRAETIIVGSGAVGLTTAVQLAHAGRQVIVLEAGGRGVENESQDYFKTAQWREHQLPGLHLGRFRLLGGTTNFWGGRLIPFDPIVFEDRPWVADVHWPITRQELDPYYDRAYKLLGLGRRLDDDGVWNRLDVVPPDLEERLEVFFSAWTPEPNLASLFRSDINASKNLCIFLNAPAVALHMESDGRVAGVHVRTVSGAVRRFDAQQVILANGTVEIVRLLKLPLADGREAPWASNPWLGRGFVEHIDCFAGHVTPIDKKRFHDLFDNAYFDGIKYMPMLKLSAQGQRDQELVGVAGQFIFNSRIREHLGHAKALLRALFRGRFQKQYVPDPRALASILRVALPMVLRYLRYRRMYNPVDQGIQLRLLSEQVPLVESALHLSDKCDHLGMPIVEMDWRVDGREIETLAIFAELVARELEKHGLANVRLDPALLARDRGFLTRGDDSYHHMGMARMAATPAQGVLDRDLKVFGTRNLFVAGAAAYPTTGFANPTFTAIALGLRLAHSICVERVLA